MKKRILEIKLHNNEDTTSKAAAGTVCTNGCCEGVCMIHLEVGLALFVFVCVVEDAAAPGHSARLY